MLTLQKRTTRPQLVLSIFVYLFLTISTTNIAQNKIDNFPAETIIRKIFDQEITFECKTQLINEKDVSAYKEVLMGESLRIDEKLYIDAVYLLSEKFSDLLENDINKRIEVFNQVKYKFLKLINNYPNSDLVDDAQRAIAVVARYTGDGKIYEEEEQKLIDNFPQGRLSYINIVNLAAKSFLISDNYGKVDKYSTFLETEVEAHLQLAYIYSKIDLFPSFYSVEKRDAEYQKIIQLYPESTLSPKAHLALGHYQYIIENYANRSLSDFETAMVNLGSSAIEENNQVKLDYFNGVLEQRYTRENYFAECGFLNTAHARWFDPSNLKLSIERKDGTVNNTDSMIVRFATDNIVKVTNGGINFSFVKPNENPNIKVTFVDNIYRSYAMLNSVIRKDHYNVIDLAWVYTIGNGDIENRKMTALHELGHAVGLGHSFDSKDIMFFYAFHANEFSQRDINTLLKFYPEENVSPQILTSLYTPSTYSETQLYVDVDAEDMNGDTLNYRIENKPAWISIDSKTGIITGKPTKNDCSTYELSVIVEDGKGKSDTKRWNFQVLSNPYTELPPKISVLPQIINDEDHSFIIDVTSYYPFIEDETPDSVLVVTFRESSQNLFLKKYDDKKYKITLKNNWYGKDSIEVHVSDLIDSSAAILYVDVNPVNDPLYVLGSFPRFWRFDGGDSCKINIWQFVDDIETPDSLLRFTFSATNDSLLVEFNSNNGIVTLKSIKNFYGDVFLEITASDEDGAAAKTNIKITIDKTTTVNNDMDILPDKYCLFQNHPNPFNPSTNISYTLPETTPVKIVIYDIIGREVTSLINSVQTPGHYNITYNAADLPTGVYFYKMVTKNGQFIKKMMFIK